MYIRSQIGKSHSTPSWTVPVSLATSVLSILSPIQAQAQVTSAQGGPNTQVSQNGNVFDISGGTQVEGNLFHEFERFSVDAGQTANFLSNSNVFNIIGQVSGLSPSYINGLLQVSGSDANLYLINPAGILFGPNGQLSLAGSFTATTADQVGFGEDWLNVLAGETDYAAFTEDPSAFAFTADAASAVVNQGDLAVAAGKSLVLMGGNVVNEGRLVAPGGEIGLVAVGGDRTVRLGIPGSLLSLEVKPNLSSGTSFLPTDLPTLLTGNPSLGASSITVLPGGIVQLNGRRVDPEEVSVTGEITTRSQTGDGGTIALLGRSVDVLSATVDASGEAGGTVRAGRGRREEANLPLASLTLFDANSVVRADGSAGGGGSIVIGAKGNASLQGALSAEGVTQGGVVETSANNLNLAGLSVAAKGQTGGAWLIDPVDIRIVDAITGSNQVTSASIEDALDNNVNVTIATTSGPGGSGDLSLLDSITQTGSSAASLTLTGRRFSTNGSKINLASTGDLTFNLNAVNRELTPSGDSVEGAIAAIGSVVGDRTVNLTDGVYTFSNTVNLNTDVDIIGASRDNTVLNIDANDRLFTVNPGNEVSLSNLTFGATTAGQGGGIANKGTLTLTNILATGNTSLPGANGGAIDSFNNSRLTVLDSEFRDNKTTISGGAIAASGTLATISNSSFKLNSAQNGGAISILNNSLLTVDNSLFENNSASVGGAIRSIGSEITLTDSIVKDNTADTGGGLHLRVGSVANLVSTQFENNRANAAGGGISALTDSTLNVGGNSLFKDNEAIDGGGIYLQSGTLNVTGSTRFERNVATVNDGGGISARGGATVNVSDAVFEENRAAEDGGGVMIEFSSAANIANTQFNNNSATDDGGGLYVSEDSQATVSGGQFAGNHADDNGGGAYVSQDSSAGFDGTSFVLNSAIASGGGLMANSRSTVEVSNATFDGNTANLGGGLSAELDSGANVNNSQFDNNVALDLGGGLYTTEKVAIANSTFSNNRAQLGGGIAVVNNGELTIANTRINNNQALEGAGLQVDSATAQVSASIFENNEAEEQGGGISARSAQVVVQDSEVKSNRAAIDGGGIRISDGAATIENTQVNDNQGGFGGGLELSGNSQVVVKNSELSNNVASIQGGGIQVDDMARLSLENSTLADNRAIALDGGGLANKSMAELVNTTLYGNEAQGEGGAIANLGSDATTTVRNSTLSQNRAAGAGGGIANSGTMGTRLLNTIVAENKGAIANDVSGSFEDDGNNLIGQSDGSTGFTKSTLVGRVGNSINPSLTPLADNGGPTRTQRLNKDSVAIDAGANNNLPAVDQRGLSRVVGATVDIGAVELTEVERFLPTAPEVPANPEVPGESPVPEKGAEPFVSRDFLDPMLSAGGGGWMAIAPNDDENADNRTISQLERTFGRSFEDYWNLPLKPARDFDDVQSILRRAQEEYKVNSAIVYAVFLPKQTGLDAGENSLYVEPTPAPDDLLHLALVMPAGELVRYQLPITREQATSQVRLLRNAVSDPEDEFGYLPLTQQLYRWLLAPLEQDLEKQGIQNLMYALDAGLRTAPVTAMRDYNGFSLERYGISVVPNMGLTQAEFGPAVKRPTVAMGVSQFDSAAPLPAVPIELAVVKNLVPVSSTLLNEGTTVNALESVQALEKPGVLHLATHTNFDHHSPESSSILMWDQPLSMKEFAKLDWLESDLNLLILSACSTALSSPNAELGFAGLAAAAGVDATVGSLWEVSDVGTLALMSEFYAQLEQTDLRFEALRRAQLALLKGETRIQNGDLLTSQGVVDLPDDWDLPENATLEHPFFWSAFTMVGNPW